MITIGQPSQDPPDFSELVPITLPAAAVCQGDGLEYDDALHMVDAIDTSISPDRVVIATHDVSNPRSRAFLTRKRAEDVRVYCPHRYARALATARRTEPDETSE